MYHPSIPRPHHKVLPQSSTGVEYHNITNPPIMLSTEAENFEVISFKHAYQPPNICIEKRKTKESPKQYTKTNKKKF